MPVTELGGHTIHVDEEGFLTDFAEWDDDLAKVLADQIGIDLGEEHWKVIRFLREDYKIQGETATARRDRASDAAAPPKESAATTDASRPVWERVALPSSATLARRVASAAVRVKGRTAIAMNT